MKEIQTARVQTVGGRPLGVLGVTPEHEFQTFQEGLEKIEATELRQFPAVKKNSHLQPAFNHPEQSQVY